MAVLVLAENDKGIFKKAAFEAVHYGHLVSKVLGESCVALVLGNADNAAQLGEYGAEKVMAVAGPSLEVFDDNSYTQVIAQAAEKLSASTIILNHSSKGKALIGRLAIKLNAGSVSGVNAVPTMDDNFKVTKNVFSGKAISEFAVNSEKRVLSLMGNSIAPEKVGSPATVENMEVDIPNNNISVKEVKTVEGIVPLPEAELVVSAGRGMKAAENWGIIEELADSLGATTACSRPVSDTGWRPHHEHVGQTGIAIRPNLYIAIGISGAIQHLAGVNNSKVIVVINKDPEAPFFKAADYGICADLFDVVPRLTAAVNNFKQST